MEEKEMLKKYEQAKKLREDIGNLLEESDLELDVVIAVLMAISTEAAIMQADMPPHVLVAKFSSAVCALVDGLQELEEGEGDEEDDPTPTTHYVIH